MSLPLSVVRLAMKAGYPLDDGAIGAPRHRRRHREEDDMIERPRVVVVGGGFAGFHAARNLSKRLGDDAEIVLVNTTDYFLYLPLLPEVAAGVLEPGGSRCRSRRACRASGWCSAKWRRSTWHSGGSAGRTPRASGRHHLRRCWRSAA
jgi:hypothetical protein